MLAVFCLLLLASLAHAQDDDPPSRIDVEASINRTIEEVERQIQADPSLPRLTRQEIVKFLQNITLHDLDEYRDKEKLERTRKLYERALMVVLPYNAEESSGSLKDLYTKPPMTQMIPDDVQKSREKGRRENEENLASENLIQNREPEHRTTAKESSATTTRYKNHRDTYSEVRTKIPIKDTLRLESTPVRFSFDLDNLRRDALDKERTTSTARYPVYRNNGDRGSELGIVKNSTGSAQEPTTELPVKRITVVPDKPKADPYVLTSSQWRYNAPPSSTMKTTVPSELDKIPFLPTVIDSQTRNGSMVSFVPEPTRGTEAEEEVLRPGTEKPMTLFVTPMSTESSSKGKYSSTYSLNSAGFRQAAATSTTTSPSMPMRPEVMDLLASIGLRPDNDSNVEDVYRRNKEILGSKLPVPASNSVQDSRDTLRNSGQDSLENDAGSSVNRNTHEDSGSEIKKGVENLAPDVQLLFQRFGLQTSLLDHPVTSSTQRAIVNPNSYTNFKPLPTSSVKDEDFREFLAKFGLGTNDDRRPKSLRLPTQPPSLLEAVPANMIGILRNIGLISGGEKPGEAFPDTVDDMESIETSKYHVFKPHEVAVTDEGQRNRINELLDTVKLVQQGKADVQSVRKLANDLLQTTKVLREGPDPLKLEETLKDYSEDARNEVKRQQQQDQPQEESSTASNVEETTSSTSASSSSLTTESADSSGTSTVAATDPARAEASDEPSTVTAASAEDSSTASNLMALEESFGGTTREPDPALPPKRKSGLYFLVDWNTFLEVGEEDKEKINLRFQPKVGDRTRFLPVTVP